MRIVVSTFFEVFGGKKIQVLIKLVCFEPFKLLEGSVGENLGMEILDVRF